MIMEFLVALLGALCVGFAIGFVICTLRETEKAAKSDDEQQRWFVRFAYQRTFFNNWRKPTQWFSTYLILKAETPEEAVNKIYDRFKMPNCLDGVKIRVFDIHEI